MIKKEVAFLVIFLLLATTVSAAKIEVSSSKDQTKVFPGNEVTFLVKVKNNQIRSDMIKISPDPFSVFPFSDFVDRINIQPSQLSVPADESGTFQVIIKYSKDIKSDKSYTANIAVRSLINEDVKQTYQLTSFITNAGEIISTRININEVIVPGKETPFYVTFTNNLNEDLNNLRLYITAGSFNEEQDFNIKAKEVMKKSFTLNLPTDTPPGEYNLILKIYSGESLKGNRETRIKVESNKELEEKVSRINNFLSTKVIISKVNKGNIAFNKEVKYPISSFENLFTETTPKSSVVEENGQKYLLWNLVIKPGEENNIVIDTNYAGLFFTVLGLVVLLGLIYYVRTRSIRITKKVIMIREGSERKIYFKVILNLENYTGKPIHNLKVIDLLPVLIKHYSDFGTLEPKNIQQGSRGLRFVWEISKLGSGEERVISYKIEPQLNLFGNIKLPPASLQFLGKTNKLIVRRSNSAAFKLNKQ